MPPSATALMICTIGRNSADSHAARYAERYISPVSTLNSAVLASSRPSAFTTRTPVMFSLKRPVMRELSLRTLRYSPRIFLRN